MCIVTGKEILLVLIAYLMGGICTGYYLVYFKTGEDIRDYGSGGVGARNVGRLLGKSGFFFTFIGDLIKGLLTILIARSFSIQEPIISAILIAVVAGHIWPIQLKLKGGRGVATTLGAFLAYDYNLIIFLLLLTTVISIFNRNLIVSGLTSILLLPIIVLIFNFEGYQISTIAITSAIILYAHRVRIRKLLYEKPHD